MNNHNKLTRREREKLTHRRQIQKAAIKVFAEKGYHSATLEEITTEAEFSKGALYHYFKNKEDLLYSLLDDGLTEMHNILMENLNSSKSLRDEIHEFIEEFLMFLKKNKDFIRVLSTQESGAFFSLDKSTQKYLTKKHAQTQEFAIQRFHKAIGAGEIEKIEPHIYAAIFHGFMHECFRVLFTDTCKTCNPLSKQDVHTMIDLIFEGIEKARTK